VRLEDRLVLLALQPLALRRFSPAGSCAGLVVDRRPERCPDPVA
jgi:hypothetical protein